MATFYESPSRTFSEYLLIPALSKIDLNPATVNLKTVISRYKKGSEDQALRINIPIVSAIMQAVSDERLAIALAKCGGISFIFQSQGIAEQIEMVKNVKKYKAGFIVSDSNAKPDDTLKTLLVLKEQTGHSTVAVTENGKNNGKLLGIVTSKDYMEHKDYHETLVRDIMTPFSELIYAVDSVTLVEANDLIWKEKLNCLPIIDKNQNLVSLVFRKDSLNHRINPDEAIDEKKRFMVGAGINTRDYKERVPRLLDAGADILCIDSSDGFSEWQKEVLHYIKKEYGDSVKVGAGNVVDADGFRYLAEAGADFVKIGIGGGSICITREQKGIGRGQATAVIEVAKARNEYYKETGIYIPLCSDGSIVYDYHIVLALAMGADFVMMGRYFARFDESPSKKVMIDGKVMKEYWAEGTNRAQNWNRYDLGGDKKLSFEEGVEGYVSYAGSLKTNLHDTIVKIRSTMVNCGSKDISELQKTAKLTVVSSTSIHEGGYHNIYLKNKE